MFVCFLFLLMIGGSFRQSLAAPCKNCSCFINAGAAFCSGANLTQIPRQLEEKSLRVIDLSDNNIASLENNNRFGASRAGLQQLTLRNNLIHTFPSYLLEGMKSLNEFDISWNHVNGNITPQHFNDTKKLDYLSMAHNAISCIQNRTFDSLVTLTELDLSYNLLTPLCLPRETLCALKSLIVLRLSNNDVGLLFRESWIFSKVKVGYFTCLRWITNIQASNCKIYSVSKYAFRHLDYLTSLDLSDNYIRSWNAETLLDTSLLVYLDLGNNYLQNIPPDFIQGCSKLSHVSLRNNELRTVEYRWLNKIQHDNHTYDMDRSIKIVQDYLQLTPPTRHFTTNIYPLEDARVAMWLDWSGNPWLCGCEMLPFVAWAVENEFWLGDVDGYLDVICYDPAHHRGNRLLDLYVSGIVDVLTLKLLLEQCKTPNTTSSAHLALISSTIHVKTTNTPQQENLEPTWAALDVRPESKPSNEVSTETNNGSRKRVDSLNVDRIVDATTGLNFIEQNLRSLSTSGVQVSVIANDKNADKSSTVGFQVYATYPRASLEGKFNQSAKTILNHANANNNTLHRVNNQKGRETSYVTVIVLCVVADIVLSLGLFLLIRKWCTQKNKTRRWATVVPISSLPSNLSSTNDIVLTPIQT